MKQTLFLTIGLLFCFGATSADESVHAEVMAFVHNYGLHFEPDVKVAYKLDKEHIEFANKLYSGGNKFDFRKCREWCKFGSDTLFINFAYRSAPEKNIYLIVRLVDKNLLKTNDDSFKLLDRELRGNGFIPTVQENGSRYWIVKPKKP